MKPPFDVAKMRKEASESLMKCTLWEYCPGEFFEALDEIERLNAKLEAASKVIGSLARDCFCHVKSADGYMGTAHADFCVQRQFDLAAYNKLRKEHG